MSAIDCVLRFVLKKRTFIFFVLYFLPGFWFSALKAQRLLPVITNIVPPDPEVAKLGTFGDFNKNLATGQVDVSIPLHTMEGLSLKYPVGLSYSSSGIRVQERATSVGQNWTFTGVGAITKTVVGKPDEQTSIGYNTTYVYGEQFVGLSLYSPNAFDNKVYRTALGEIDMEPDIFSFSFNGRGGKFFYDPSTSQYYTMPYSKLAITRSTMGPGGEFQVIDEKGYKYVFGQSSDTFNDYGSGSSGMDFSASYTSQWYLTKVYAPDGNLEFSFDYVKGPLIQESISEGQRIDYLASTTGCAQDGNPAIMPESGGGTSYNNVSRSGWYLSKINCPLEAASFFYKTRTDGSLRLDSVSLSKNGIEKQNWRLFQGAYTEANKSRLDSVCQYTGQKRVSKYSLEYDPINIPATDSKSQDLWGYYNGASNSSLVPKIWYGQQYLGNADRSPKLEMTRAGILTKIKYPTGGSTEFIYELNDYGSSGTGKPESEPILGYTPNSLNRYYSKLGPGTSTTTFTLDTTAVMSFSSYRDNCDNKGKCSNEPNTVDIFVTGNKGPWSLNGPEKKVSSTLLSLEAGTYTVNVTTNDVKEYGQVSFAVPAIVGYNHKIPAGGLRIKKMVNYDPVTGQSSVRKFDYLVKGQSDRSSGVVLSKPDFIYQYSVGNGCSLEPGKVGRLCESWMNFVSVSSNSNVDLFFSDGTPVSYSRVLESIGEQGEGGSIEHIFSYQSDLISRQFPFPSNVSNSWRRGLPVETNYLTATGDTTRREFNEYNFDLSRNYHLMVGYKVGISRSCSIDPLAIRVQVGDMSYKSEWFYLTKNKKVSYSSANQRNLEELTEYFYDNPDHLQATSTRKRTSQGNTTVSHFKYPLDYSLSASSADSASAALYKMQQKNMIEYPVEQSEGIDNAVQETVKKSTLFLYKEFAPGQLYNSKVYEFSSEVPVVYGSLSSSTGGVFNFSAGYQKLFEATLYNNKGQLVEFSNKGGLKKSVLYHSNGLLPVAIATNASANRIYYNGFEESTLPFVSNVGKYGRKGYNGVFVVPGSTMPAGNYLKSWWEQVAGAWRYYTVPFSHNGTDNVVFGNGGLIDNVAVYPAGSVLESYDYDPGEGLINKVRANGIGVQFKYDPLLRLQQLLNQNGDILKSYDYHYQPY